MRPMLSVGILVHLSGSSKSQGQSVCDHIPASRARKASRGISDAANISDSEQRQLVGTFDPLRDPSNTPDYKNYHGLGDANHIHCYTTSVAA